MANFIYDVFWDILLCLAVKDLLRFRCVSKFFSSLIDSRDFIKLHLSHSQSTKTNLYGIPKKDLFRQVEIFDITKYVKNDVVSLATVSLPLVSNKLVAVGSCNGLIALLNQNYIEGDIDITIWNPFTGKSKKVGVSIPPDSKLRYGFGYDPETDDYKLVKIVESWNPDYADLWGQVTYKTAVYSLKTDTWREIGKDWSSKCGSDPWIDKTGVVANNALHWKIPYAPNDTKIVAFDLVKEELYYIPALECWSRYDLLLLSVRDRCLSMTNAGSKGTCVWIMNRTRTLAYSSI